MTADSDAVSLMWHTGEPDVGEESLGRSHPQVGNDGDP